MSCSIIENYHYGRKVIALLDSCGEISDGFRFCDTNELVNSDSQPKPCPGCGLEFTQSHIDKLGKKGWIDPCLGVLPGVNFACCGHGVGNGYISFENGRIIRFQPKIIVEQWNNSDIEIIAKPKNETKSKV